jgi:hypothetical protein
VWLSLDLNEVIFVVKPTLSIELEKPRACKSPVAFRIVFSGFDRLLLALFGLELFSKSLLVVCTQLFERVI